jgi:hypothetical protein
MAAQGANLGTDFYCEDDISDDFAYESDPVRAYVQACFRRLGLQTLFYADPYGAGVFRFVLDSGQSSEAMRAAVVDALMLDERTQNVEVVYIDGQPHVKVTPHNAPAFKFVLAIDDVAKTITEKF